MSGFVSRGSSRKLILTALALMVVTLAGLGACDQRAATDNRQSSLSPANNNVSLSGKPLDEMILIPAGDFIMGSDDVDTSGKSQEFGFNEPWYLPEHPKRKVYQCGVQGLA